jgi:NhaC family Na+:H+ antiporter
MSEQEQVQPKKSASFLLALTPIIFLVGLLGLNVLFYEDNSTSGPNQIALLLATAFTAVIGFRLKYNWEELLNGIVKSIRTALPAVLILLIIGALSGTWMLSGVVPTMIYYGLEIMSPKFFLVAACIVCAVISIATGSSWTTTATVGVALIGIAKTMGIHEGIAAGAIISGAYFGDKMSPLSDTTNLAPAMAGTDLFTHIKYMAYTTIPSFIISLLLFFFIGLSISGKSNDLEIQKMLTVLENTYTLSPFLLIVPLIVIFLILKKVDAVPALLIGTLAGAAAAIIAQPQIIKSIGGFGNEIQNGFTYMKQSYVAAVNAMSSSVSVTTTDSNINELIGTSGMSGMLSTIWLIICAMCFGGVMEVTGLLKKITNSVVKLAKSTGSLIATTASTCVFFNATASDQYLAIVVPGRMYADTFRERGLKPEVLSRTLEDAGTVTSVLIPWNTCGAYQSNCLNVATGDYFMYCFFNLLSPLMTVTYGYLNIKIRKFSEQERNEMKAEALFLND